MEHKFTMNAKGFLQLPNLYMLLKQKSPLLPRNLALGTFGKLLIVFPRKINLSYLFCSMTASDKANLFAKNFSKNSNLDDLGISLPVLPSRTNLKLHSVSVTHKMVKKIITNFDLLKASGLNYIPVGVLKNRQSEHSYILADSSMCGWKSLVFQTVGRSHWWPPVFKNVGERSIAKGYHPISLLSVVIKVLKLVSDKIVDHLEKCGLFSDVQCGFWFSQSTADLLTLVSDSIARGFNRSRGTEAVALDISKAFNRVWHEVLLYKLSSSSSRVHCWSYTFPTIH